MHYKGAQIVIPIKTETIVMNNNNFPENMDLIDLNRQQFDNLGKSKLS